MLNKNLPPSIKTFNIVLLGQFVSLLGTGMTSFALIIWAYQKTGQVTTLGLMTFFTFAPAILFGLIAGPIIDRYNRKTILIASEVLALFSVIFLLLTLHFYKLQIWHLYVVATIAGAAQSFQLPAYSAAITTLIPPDQLTRANGMQGLAQNASGIMVPTLAGALLAWVGLQGVLIFDLFSFVIGIIALMVVHIPAPVKTTTVRTLHGIGAQIGFGFRYLFGHPARLGLLFMFAAINVIAMVGMTIIPAMVLAKTNNNEVLLGAIRSAGAVGSMVGGLLLTVWGGPKKRIHVILAAMILASIFDEVVMGVSHSLPLWMMAGFMTGLVVPVAIATNLALWQTKIPSDVQGRVFSARRVIVQILIPVTTLLVGPLADRVFEPAMMTDGAWANTFGWLVGVGSGSGSGLLLVMAGLIGIAIGISGYFINVVRNVESILPDCNTARESAPRNG